MRGCKFWWDSSFSRHLTLSFAPRDSHKSQIQFALERGIPSFVAMLGTRPLPFPAFSFDFVRRQDKEWADLQAVARSLCYDLIAVDGNTAVCKKPVGDSCLPNQKEFGLEFCRGSDDPSYGC